MIVMTSSMITGLNQRLTQTPCVYSNKQLGSNFVFFVLVFMQGGHL